MHAAYIRDSLLLHSSAMVKGASSRSALTLGRVILSDISRALLWQMRSAGLTET